MKENFNLVFSILKNQFTSLFFILLFISVLVSYFVGEYVDGTIILVIVLINTLLDLYQEFNASKASQKLLSMIQRKVYVYRNGKIVEISSADVLVGDIAHFIVGSVLPFDIEVIEAENAFIDESVRTGETLPKEVFLGDKIFAASTISSGKIVGHVLTLEKNSSLIEYKNKLQEVKKWSSFNHFTNNVIKYVFIISLISLLLAMFFLVFVMGKFELTSFFVFAIAMLVGIVPEMLPLIITIILTRESIDLSKNKVLVKRLSSLESIGALKFLLTDKTGTLTENKLKVSHILDHKDFWEISNSISEGDYERTALDIAYDEALNNSVAKIKTNTLKIKHFTQFTHKDGYEVFILENGNKVARGILTNILDLTKNDFDKKEILEKAYFYENKGMRVMGIASSLANVWEFSGFVAFYDPVKATAFDSIQIANEKGISVKILTGDSKEVSLNLLSELKISSDKNDVVSLNEVNVSELSDEELLNIKVFAKCKPEDKLFLIDRFIKLGPVAFLGDGINDALALKRADVGIAVSNATDIAKEASDIILLEKDITPILKSVDTGRKATRNILIYIMYTLAGNAKTFLSLLVASFFYPVLPMLPIHVLLNNLITDLPLMLIITDNIDKYALSHVPHFETKKIIKRIVIFGFIGSLFDLIYFEIFKDSSVSLFQTGWFLFSILIELALILSIRSSRSFLKSPPMSVPLIFGVFCSVIVGFVFIYQSSLAKLFKFEILSFSTLFTLASLVIIYVFVNEFIKFIMRRNNLYNKPVLVNNK